MKLRPVFEGKSAKRRDGVGTGVGRKRLPKALKCRRSMHEKSFPKQYPKTDKLVKVRPSRKLGKGKVGDEQLEKSRIAGSKADGITFLAAPDAGISMWLGLARIKG